MIRTLGFLAALLFLGTGSAADRQPSNLLSRQSIAGRSAAGRPITMQQLGNPALGGEVLVFGCIHGDECAASGVRPLVGGCPPTGVDVYVVPNLNPDGAALKTRLNGRGVDLNRNFPAEWKPIGHRGGSEFSGPRPLSEPESRLAARIIERVRPDVTIWFHQERSITKPYVRAWGQSVPAARRFAALSKMRFALLPWLAGTAPNWQNHTFRGTAAFVVELPRGPLPRAPAPGSASSLGIAILRLARQETARS